MDKGGDIDDIIDVNDDSESSSSSSNTGVYEPNQPLVLELHDIRKDDPNSVETIPTVVKKKIKTKKKGQPLKESSSSSLSSDSLSEASSLDPSFSEGKEEFYDAHESYHAISENQNSLVPPRLGRSEESQNIRTTSKSFVLSEPQSTTSSSRRLKEPSTISKPSIPPE